MSEQKNEGGQQRGQGGEPGRGQQQSQTPKTDQKKPKSEAQEEGVVADDKLWERGSLGT